MIPKGSDWKFVIEGFLFAWLILPFLMAQFAKLTSGRKTVSQNR